MELRPVTEADLVEVDRVKRHAFDALVVGMGQPPMPLPTSDEAAHGLRRLRHLITADPALCRIAVDQDGRIVGGAFAAVREGIWILSLLFVDPTRHSRGLGGRLMDAVAPVGGGPGLIAASDDPRALRLYAGHGFAPWPILRASGPMRRPIPRQDGVVDGDRDDPLLGAVDRHGRGAPRTADMPLLMGPGSRLRVLPRRGYAISDGHKVVTVSAVDDDAAATLLRDALSFFEVGDEVDARWIRGNQQWAVDVLIEAGFGLRAEGAICSRGVDLATSYLPSGPYL